jgi:hypothetical protein
MTFKDDPATENKYFDQRSCGKVIRIGAIACVATLVGDVLFLVLVDPLHSRCGWAIQKEIGGSSMWALLAPVGFVGLWAAWIGLVAIKWDWFARRVVDRLERDELWEETDVALLHMVYFREMLIAIMVFSVFTCAVPLLIVANSLLFCAVHT